MWRKGRYIPSDKRKQLYFAYVQSHLTYMLPVYSLGSKTKMDELQTLQNGCIKALFRLQRGTPTTYLYSSSVLPLKMLAVAERVTHLHKMLKSKCKHKFDINLNRDINNRALRRRSQVHISVEQSINKYNRLSSEIRQCDSVDAFILKVKLKMMDESDEFHTVSPFYNINWSCDVLLFLICNFINFVLFILPDLWYFHCNLIVTNFRQVSCDILGLLAEKNAKQEGETVC